MLNQALMIWRPRATYS